MALPITDHRRLCIHTITTRPWAVELAIEKYAAAGVGGITVWRQALEGRDAAHVGRFIRDHGMSAVSLCRGGFFVARDGSARTAALDDNRRAIDEAAALGAPLVVLVCGAVPGLPLTEARLQIQEAIGALLPHASANGVKLAIEPLHPMYAGDRSAVNTLKQANDMCHALGSSDVGVAVDVYHTWWDPDLEAEIRRCGANRWLLAFHVCDWLTPTTDMLNDRGVMGEGCIDLPAIRGWVEEAGFHGFREVEIFSNRLWALDQDAVLSRVLEAHLTRT
jgi:sugar phosphate isomerase/epimerase